MRLIESKYKTGKVITSFQNFVGYLNESSSYSSQEITKKINRATLWISVNKPFYGELFSHLNIWGSYDLVPNTIATNGRDIIFHPDFVMKQSDKALRFAIMHEILHCISEHYDKRENRDPKIWNLACDYVVNPMLIGEDGIEPPVDANGQPAFVHNPQLEATRAEDIYDIIIRTRKTTDILKSETGYVIDWDAEVPKPDPDLLIYTKGDEDYQKLEDQPNQEKDEEDELTDGEDEMKDKEPGCTACVGDSPTGSSEQPGDGQPTGGTETPQDSPSGDQPTGGTETPGDSPSGDQPTGGTEPPIDPPPGGQPTGGTGPTGGQPTGGTGPTGGQPTGGTGPTGGQPTGGTGPTGEKGSDEKIRVQVGDRVMTNKGSGTVTQVFPNGDIEVKID